VDPGVGVLPLTFPETGRLLAHPPPPGSARVLAGLVAPPPGPFRLTSPANKTHPRCRNCPISSRQATYVTLIQYLSCSCPDDRTCDIQISTFCG
jgi:hypothetical protein